MGKAFFFLVNSTRPRAAPTRVSTVCNVILKIKCLHASCAVFRIGGTPVVVNVADSTLVDGDWKEWPNEGRSWCRPPLCFKSIDMVFQTRFDISSSLFSMNPVITTRRKKTVQGGYVAFSTKPIVRVNAVENSV